jgi:glycosyltransferase involved in cell wall biosynthesis
MKLALFHNLPTGGAKRIFLGLIKELNRLNHEITIFTPHKGGNENIYDMKIKSKHLNLISWPNPTNAIDYLKIIHSEYLDNCRKIAKIIDNGSFDYLILGGDWITNTPSIPLFLKTKSISITHELKREYYQRTFENFKEKIKQNLWKKLVEKTKNWEVESLNKCEKIIANSLYSARQIKNVIKDRNKIKVIYPFINKKFINMKNNQTKGNFYLTIGNNNYLKGHNFVFKSLRNEFSNLNLHVVTTKENKTNLYKLINKSNLNKIKVLTNVSDQKLISLYQQSKGLIYFPQNEPFGLTPIEALSSNCPIIGVNEGGFTEVITKSKNAKLIPRSKTLLINSIGRQNRFKKDHNFENYVKNNLSVEFYTKKLLELIK